MPQLRYQIPCPNCNNTMRNDSTICAGCNARRNLDECHRRVADISPSERFWGKVEITSTCWLWNGSRNWTGYGMFSIGHQHILAHRFAYMTLIGLIPEGLELDHLCRTPACVCPEHLEPVTHKENTHRGFMALGGHPNSRKTHCKNGHPFLGEHVRITTAGSRRCLTCKRNYDALRYQEVKR